MEQHVPALVVPLGGDNLWRWYFEVSDGLRRVLEGVCAPIPWSEWIAWRRETGTIVRPSERAILRRMDEAFCAETNKELAAYRERQAEKAAQEAKRQ